jgi:2-polyprenyl-3-methyl-5-hydroxy-6-metoxy-1,4-benzoquinol methylase
VNAQSTASYDIRKREWERFASEDPHFYICTELPRGNVGVFWQSGEDLFQRELMPVIERYNVQYGTAVEIGSGLGRLLFPLSRRFKLVFGLDIAERMVSQATSLAAQRGITNARFLTIDDPKRLSSALDPYRGKVDFLYSLFVLQHIDDFRIIEAYIGATGGLLAPAGIAYLQFDTRQKTPLYFIKTALPDALLPPNLRRGARRIRWNSSDIESCFARHRLTVLETIMPRTALHRYVLQISG